MFSLCGSYNILEGSCWRCGTSPSPPTLQLWTQAVIQSCATAFASHCSWQSKICTETLCFKRKNSPATATNNLTFLIFSYLAVCLAQKPKYGVPNVPGTCTAGFTVSSYLALELLSKVTPVHTWIENRTREVPELWSHPSLPNWPASQSSQLSYRDAQGEKKPLW